MLISTKTYGGTNWGNLGYPEGYTSYDYGAAIAEDRTITREKYVEAKLEANFLSASIAYITANPGNLTTTSYVSNDALAVTPLFGNRTNFYVVRQSAYQSNDSVSYTLTVSTSIGNVTIPQLGGSLTLNGRDSKIHVTDYALGGIDLIYSSAEVFTWKKSGSKSVVLLYGGEGETHELALPKSLGTPTVEGSGLTISTNSSATIINWDVTPTRRILQFNDTLDVYLLWRNDAYNYWILELPAASPIGNFTSPSKSSVIIKAGYLLRTASITGSTLYLTGDINATTTLEVIGTGSSSNVTSIYFNNSPLTNLNTTNGRLTATLSYSPPTITPPSLSTLTWKYLNTLPEIYSNYSDALWTACDFNYTNNTVRPLTTPTSLYADDYGYHTGSLIYRGHFTSTGNESSFYLYTQGGYAYAHSIWLNSTFIGSFTGTSVDESWNQTYLFPSTLVANTPYVITVLIDHMGLDENYYPGEDQLKDPRGILDYSLSTNTPISWKMTGNLGGEKYRDKVRGPLNEGAMYAERQGYHQPDPPSATWPVSSPFDGISAPGVAFYSTNFTLDIPDGYDVPMSFVFTNTTGNSGSAIAAGTNSTSTGSDVAAFRIQLYVNGYQFGKYGTSPPSSHPPSILSLSPQSTT